MRRRSHSRVELRSVTKRFDGAMVLDDCSVNFEPGLVTGLIGPSGCGKTTVIDLIAGYVSADAGEVLLDDVAVSGPSWERLVVFQEGALFPWKSTLANVTFGPLNRGVPQKEAQRSACVLLGKLGLAGFAGKFPNQLSGGMQRRAELARALVNEPKVMLLDEPFRGLDALTRELLQEYLLKVYEEDPVTTVFVTTEIDEAIFLCDTIVMLSNPPTSVRKVITVDLPRPRSLKMLSTSRYAELHKEVLDQVLTEARNALGEGMEDAAQVIDSVGRAMKQRASSDS